MAPFSDGFSVTEAHTPLGKQLLARRSVSVVPATASCSGFVLSCVIPVRSGWEKVLFILVVLNWAGNQHALLRESLLITSYQSICPVVTHPMNTHILLLVSMRCLL